MTKTIYEPVGYIDGVVWIDSKANNTNTEPFIDGVIDHPVSTMKVAEEIMAKIGITKPPKRME